MKPIYRLDFTTKFKKDLKKVKKNGRDYKLSVILLRLLETKGVKGIPKTMRPHKLKGNYQDNWECHITPDLLIIWIQIESPNVIRLIRIGSHSDLFN
jgi:mRNA interferase YafQ